MKLYRDYKLFTESKGGSKDFKKSPLKASIESICKKYRIKNYIINEDGTVDVRGRVSLSDLGLNKLPINFGNVEGDFYCSGNELTSLEGSPKSVGGYFDCSSNKLTSLKGSPKSVGGYFDCYNNQLTSLKGSPDSVGRDFDCSHNKLTSLKGSPDSVGGGFDCTNNKLNSLEGSPKSVGGHFDCSSNKLTSLEGSPKLVDGEFNCSGNQLLNLKGISDHFKSIKLEGNPVKKIFDFFPRKDKTIDIKIINWINEYDVINGNKISIDRLEDLILKYIEEEMKNIDGYQLI